MNKIYLFISALCLSLNSNAQITFEKTIDTLGGTFANCVQQTFDGGYILCGGSHLGGNDAIVVKTDSLGIVEWAKTYSGPGIEGGLQIEQTPDSGYILNGVYDVGLYGRHWLLKLTAFGDTTWTKSYTINSTGSSFAWMSVNNNGYCGLTGYYKSPTFHNDAYLIITNDSGITVSSHLYNTTYGSEGHAICKTPGNGYMICGVVVTSPTIKNAYLIRTDSLGDTLWTQVYGFSNIDVGRSVMQTSDSGFIVGGSTYNSAIQSYNALLFKIDFAGNLIWSKIFGNSIPIEGNSVQQSSDGGYAFLCRIVNGSPLNGNIYLIKTDSNGDTLWTRQYGGTGPDDGYFVQQTLDAGYIICGSGLIGSNGGIYLIKTNDSGLVVITSPVVEVIDITGGFNIFPTLNSGRFNIQIIEKSNRNCIFEIYNSLSQKIFSQPLINDMNTKEISLNAPNGIYITVLRVGEEMYSQKMIVQH